MSRIVADDATDGLVLAPAVWQHQVSAEWLNLPASRVVDQSAKSESREIALVITLRAGQLGMPGGESGQGPFFS
jgi:hypothetical protein